MRTGNYLTQTRMLATLDAIDYLRGRLDLLRAQLRGAASMVGSELDSFKERGDALIQLAALANDMTPQEIKIIELSAIERANFGTSRSKANKQARQRAQAAQATQAPEPKFRQMEMSAQTQYEHDNLLGFETLRGWEELGQLVNDKFGSGAASEVAESRLAKYLISICSNDKDDPDNLMFRATTTIEELVDRGLLNFTVTQGEEIN